MRRPVRSFFAFTLVELLVVIGIIGVLISILIPALSRARQSAMSVTCMSNMKQVGLAALMYAQNSRGQLPPSQAADPSGNATDEKFLDYGPVTSGDRYAVWVAMAKYAGYKVPEYPAPAGVTYVSPRTPAFYCPSDDQVVGTTPPWEENNMLAHTGTGTNDGKFRYWWVANPLHFYDTATLSSIAGKSDDLLAAAKFSKVDQDPPVFDATTACVSGRDYIRTTKDKHASDIAIMVDRSKQQTAVGGWYMMHGGSGPQSRKGWKNELFGDGHCESRRIEQMKARWAPANPQAW